MVLSSTVESMTFGVLRRVTALKTGEVPENGRKENSAPSISCRFFTFWSVAAECPRRMVGWRDAEMAKAPSDSGMVRFSVGKALLMIEVVVTYSPARRCTAG